MSLTVNCPTCCRLVTWNEEAEFKPFCSERCKLIDLGDWADEKHVIPVKLDLELDEADFEPESFFKE